MWCDMARGVSSSQSTLPRRWTRMVFVMCAVVAVLPAATGNPIVTDTEVDDGYWVTGGCTYIDDCTCEMEDGSGMINLHTLDRANATTGPRFWWANDSTPQPYYLAWNPCTSIPNSWIANPWGSLPCAPGTFCQTYGPSPYNATTGAAPPDWAVIIGQINPYNYTVVTNGSVTFVRASYSDGTGSGGRQGVVDLLCDADGTDPATGTFAAGDPTEGPPGTYHASIVAMCACPGRCGTPPPTPPTSAPTSPTAAPTSPTAAPTSPTAAPTHAAPGCIKRSACSCEMADGSGLINLQTLDRGHSTPPYYVSADSTSDPIFLVYNPCSQISNSWNADGGSAPCTGSFCQTFGDPPGSTHGPEFAYNVGTTEPYNFTLVRNTTNSPMYVEIVYCSDIGGGDPETTTCGYVPKWDGDAYGGRIGIVRLICDPNTNNETYGTFVAGDPTEAPAGTYHANFTSFCACPGACAASNTPGPTPVPAPAKAGPAGGGSDGGLIVGVLLLLALAALAGVTFYRHHTSPKDTVWQSIPGAEACASRLTGVHAFGGGGGSSSQTYSRADSTEREARPMMPRSYGSSPNATVNDDL